MSEPPPRQWLMDRINGDSKYGDRERPWFPCCWVPPFVAWCPGLCEENGCCKSFGKLGIYKSEASRFYLMHLSIMMNTLAMLMIVYACAALSDDYDVLTRTSFTKIVLKDGIGDIAPGTTLNVGLRSVAVYKQDIGEVVVNFDQFCGLERLDLFMDPNDCNACNDISINMSISVILAAVLFFPSVLTNIARMYSGYDVNCQKFFSGALALCSILLCLNTLLTFQLICADKFYQDFIPFNGNGQVDFDKPSYYVDYDWTWGWGMIFLIAGIVLRFLEMLTNCCVPTPTITRERKEQILYENIMEAD